MATGLPLIPDSDAIVLMFIISILLLLLFYTSVNTYSLLTWLYIIDMLRESVHLMFSTLHLLLAANENYL